MKNVRSKIKHLCGCGFLCLALLCMGSCADGFDSNESFTSSVTDSQLESPNLDTSKFATKVNPDGSESIQVVWDVVHGAGGYECQVSIVDDPQNPQQIFNEIIDGTSFLFDKKEDTKYEVSVRTLGNEKYNNKEASSAMTVAYSTMIPAKVVPANVDDLVAFIKQNIEDVDTEQAFELEAGAVYEINSELDFGEKQVTFRGSKVNRPKVIFGYDGVIRTAGGLKIKFINFDCGSQSSNGVVEGSENPSPAMISTKGNAYYLKNPVIFQECFFKNVTSCLFTPGRCTWAVEDVRVMDCIVQLDNDGKKFGNGAVISGYSDDHYFEGGQQWRCGIRNITVKNSTIYNIKTNSKNRFIRFSNNGFSNYFATGNNGSATLENNTLCRVMTGKEFANNTPNKKEYVIAFNNNICYDSWRLQKFIQGNCTKNVDMTTNTIWGVSNSVDNTDKSKYATEEDPLFSGEPYLQVLDLDKPNGGVDFKAGGAISSKVGDPRWH